MDMMERVGASFAGFATYLDSSPAFPDTYARPDVSCAVQLPWKREVAWVPSDLVCRGVPIGHGPRNVLKAQVAAAKAAGFTVKTGVEVEFFLLTSDGTKPVRTRAHTRERGSPGRTEGVDGGRYVASGADARACACLRVCEKGG
jgi:glutamine synthetase